MFPTTLASEMVSFASEFMSAFAAKNGSTALSGAFEAAGITSDVAPPWVR
jgi:hypothetical protein